MLLSTRSVFALQALTSAGLLATGLVLGEVARLHPCHLCNFQRLTYMLVAFFSFSGLLLPAGRKLWSLLAGLSALAGMFAAAQQSWMQYAPHSVTECGFGDPTLVEQIVNWLGSLWPAMFMVTGACTQKEWVLFGLSLANWSMLCFTFLSLVSAGLFFGRFGKR
jgi:protein dithiol:quinone oxidoreductase